jgi:hypothetical protein
MKARCIRSLVAASFLLGVGSVSAQQDSADASFVAPRPRAPKLRELPSDQQAAPSSGITGVVAEALKLRKPLEMVNPLAPKKYGDGQDSVTWDPDNPEKPKGIILFGFQW